MHDPTPDTSLGSFAAVLASELPGTWTSAYHPDQGSLNAHHVLTDAVWDMNEIAEALARHPVDHCAVLQRHDGTRLFVTEQPGHTEGYLIAALAPDDVPAEAFRGVREPDGIAIDADPFSAAEDITKDLLPRYDKALAQVRVNASWLLPPPPVEPERVVMTWSGDALTVDKPARADITKALTENGFVLAPDRDVFVLSGDDTAHQAACVRAAGECLSALGIDTVLRHPPTRPVLGTTPVAPPATSPVPSARRR